MEKNNYKITYFIIITLQKIYFFPFINTFSLPLYLLLFLY
jgi:hypothetical protein